MHPDPIVRRFHTCFLAGLPACLWGDPGTGKTERVKAYAKARGLHLERWLLSRCESIDIKPRAQTHDGRIVVSDPPEIQRIREAGKTGKKSVLFFDEKNRCERPVEGASLDIIDSPPPDTFVIAACNAPSRGQAARNLESAAANRYVHLEVQADAKAWALAQVAGWPVHDFVEDEIKPETLSKAQNRAAAIVSGFIRRRQDLLEKQPDNPAEAGKAWPSTRTWDYLKRVDAVALASGLPEEDRQALLTGCVGAGALEYLAFFADADLVDPEEALANPTKVLIDPSRPDRVVAMVTSVVGAVTYELTNARWEAAWDIMARCCPDQPTPGGDVPDAAISGMDQMMAFYAKLKDEKDPRFAKLTPPTRKITSRMAVIVNAGSKP